MFGGIIYLPLFLQIVNGRRATNVGSAAAAADAGHHRHVDRSGRVISRTGRYKAFPVVGHAGHDARHVPAVTMGADHQPARRRPPTWRCSAPASAASCRCWCWRCRTRSTARPGHGDRRRHLHPLDGRLARRALEAGPGHTPPNCGTDRAPPPAARNSATSGWPPSRLPPGRRRRRPSARLAPACAHGGQGLAGLRVEQQHIQRAPARRVGAERRGVMVRPGCRAAS